MTALMFGFLPQHRAEHAPGGRGVPVAGLLRRPCVQPGCLRQHAVVALGEQRARCCRSARRRCRRTGPCFWPLTCGHWVSALPWALPTVDVVEGDVERRAATGGEPVVVDRDDALALVASCSIAAPDAGRGRRSSRTLTPLDSICSAMVFILLGRRSAFWMSQLRLYFVQLGLERGRVGGDPARRGRGVGQDDADLRALAVDGSAGGEATGRRRGRRGGRLGGRGRAGVAAAAARATAASANAATTPIAATGTLLLAHAVTPFRVGAARAPRADAALRMLCARTYPSLAATTARHQLVT